MKLSRRSAALIIIAVGGFLVCAIFPDWLSLAWRNYIPRWFERTAIHVFLQTTRALFLLVVASAPFVASIAAARVVRRRRRGYPASWSARMLICSVTLLALAVLCEIAARYALHRPLPLPRPARLADGPENSIDVAVVGESTAGGWPYGPSISVAQVVTWRLEQLLPGRRARLDMQAVEPGSCLDQAMLRLKRLPYRPDVVLVCAGHNEFQTRYGWPRRPWYYADSRSPVVDLLQRACRFSKLVSFFNQQIDKNQVDALPDGAYRRELVDCPCCTATEYAAVLDNYRRRLEALVAWCDDLGALCIVVTPPSNLGSFPPNRSYLAEETPAAERDVFRQQFLAARDREEQSPGEAETEFRRLVTEQPLFAESHFRLARLLERQGKFDEAQRHFRRARDLDGMPLRCPSDFAAAAEEVCRQHPHALWVDGPDVVRRLSPHGIADDHLMHDAQHPNLRGYLGLAQEALRQLAARRALGLPEDAAAPPELAECIEHFGIERLQWEQACLRSAQFYEGVAWQRYAPDELTRRSEDYRAAAQRITAGERPENVEVLGLASGP